MRQLNTISYRELDIWSTLVFDIGISIYYFIQVARLPAGVGIYSFEMGQIITNVITYSIIAAILIEVVLSACVKKEEKDERDYKIEAASNTGAYRTLVVCAAILIGFVAINGAELNSSVLGKVEITSMLIANLLLFCLFITTAIKALIQLYFYRRGF